MVKMVLNVKELLEWVYKEQKVQAVYPKRGKRLKVNPVSVRTFATMTSQAGELGFVVRGVSAGLSTPVDSDAEYVHAVVCGLPEMTALLVMQYAKTGDVPWWAPEGYRREVPLRRKGKIVQKYDSNKNPVGIHMQIIGYDPANVDAARAEYSLWFDGLKAIEEYFFNQARPLQSLELKVLELEKEPWHEKKGLPIRL
jgi:hypothetical protein